MGRNINHNEFIGKKIGKVVIKSFSHAEPMGKNNRVYYFYNYKCECGSDGITGKHTLLAAKNYSCKNCRGIKLAIRNKVTSKKYNDPVDAKASILFSNYKAKCKMKNWSFDLSFENFRDLVLQNCHYCNLEPNKFRKDRAKSRQGISRILFNGIDRLDSNKGYSISNCVPCCEDCNKAKRNLSYDQFINLIKKIYEFKIKE